MIMECHNKVQTAWSLNFELAKNDIVWVPSEELNWKKTYALKDKGSDKTYRLSWDSVGQTDMVSFMHKQ